MANMSVATGVQEGLAPVLEILEGLERSDTATATDCVGAVRDVLPSLLGDPSWLPVRFRSSSPGQRTTTQFLLAGADDGSWCVVSVVWPGGVATPIHDHGVWGVSAQLVGHLVEVRYRRSETGGLPLAIHSSVVCEPGDITSVVPPFDVHSVLNPMGTDAVALQVYGRDLATVDRHIFDLTTNDERPYTTTYDPPTPSA